jgi:hypothetical protein
MEAAALSISVVALVVSVLGGYRAQRLSRHANTLPVLVQLFSEHRGERLAEGRRIVRQDMEPVPREDGFASIPAEQRQLVRELAWFYDNLGALVAHDIVDLAPVSGYLGTSVVETWRVLEPFITVERTRRARDLDPSRYLEYFENLAFLIDANPPLDARTSQRNWCL